MERHDTGLFSRRLKAAMVHREVTVEGLAEELNVSLATVRSWLAGRYEPKLSTAAAVADHLEVSLEWLAGGLADENDVLTPGDRQRLKMAYRQLQTGGNIIREIATEEK